jgi:L-alanine-DL-glutamate epimerase-like enolase superfamily enzyme
MIFNKLEFINLEIPFRRTFKHAAAERKSTETIIIVAHNHSVKGYGEGCPRRYVTGEDISSCKIFFDTYSVQLRAIEDLEALKSWVSNNSSLIDKNPAAWCAIEMALLDILAKGKQQPIESLLNTPRLKDSFKYTAILGVSDPQAFEAQLNQYKQLGFTEYKVKLSGNFQDDRQNIRSLTTLIPNAHLRLDANNLWKTADEAIKYISSLDSNFWAIEEPLQINQYSDLKVVAQNLRCQIILDESFLRKAQLLHIQDDLDIWIPNIRISKMGGILRAFEIAEQCKKLGLKFIIGAQVGETSFLTRAALCLANSYRKCLLAQEGGFRHLSFKS